MKNNQMSMTFPCPSSRANSHWEKLHLWTEERKREDRSRARSSSGSPKPKIWGSNTTGKEGFWWGDKIWLLPLKTKSLGQKKQRNGGLESSKAEAEWAARAFWHFLHYQKFHSSQGCWKSQHRKVWENQNRIRELQDFKRVENP